jgi:hypothetical protein
MDAVELTASPILGMSVPTFTPSQPRSTMKAPMLPGACGSSWANTVKAPA